MSLIMLGCVIRANEKYYPQTFLEECQYEIKNNKIEILINDDFNPCSSDSKSDNESDNKYNN